jgi:hypothetical protein
MSSLGCCTYQKLFHTHVPRHSRASTLTFCTKQKTPLPNLNQNINWVRHFKNSLTRGLKTKVEVIDVNNDYNNYLSLPLSNLTIPIPIQWWDSCIIIFL